MIYVVALDTYHWWGPAGWLARNTPGNLAASGICFVIAGCWAYVKVWKAHIKPHIAITREIHAHLKTHDSRLRVVQSEIEKET